ncbi:hypothetical protein [Rhizobium sp. RAF56]|uniref:hypothetical protein n=1 Tax=Rhizobium sp. RAF56 TaxID=3233062 RepID=UPI003F95F086
MFAGRYLWWTLISIATFLFFAVYFDYIAWVLVQTSGCSEKSGTCDPLENLLLRDVKPIGFLAVGGMVFVSMVGRIQYLRMSWLWSLAVAVWFMSAEPFPMLFIDIWEGRLRIGDIFDAIPFYLLFLSAFGSFLLIPFDEMGRRPLGNWRLPRFTAAASAAYSVVFTLATAPSVVQPVAHALRRPDIAATFDAWRVWLLDIFPLGGETPTGHWAYLVFVLSLAIAALPQKRIEIWLRRALWGAPHDRSRVEAFVKELAAQKEARSA